MYRVYRLPFLQLVVSLKILPTHPVRLRRPILYARRRAVSIQAPQSQSVHLHATSFRRCLWTLKYPPLQYHSEAITLCKSRTYSIATYLSRRTSSTPTSSSAAGASQYGHTPTPCPGHRAEGLTAWLSVTLKEANMRSVPILLVRNTLYPLLAFST